MTTMLLNNELNGVEIYFDGKPVRELLNKIKEVGFRWNGKKLCWYAKQSENTIAAAQQIVNDKIDITEVKPQSTKKNNKLVSLYERLQFVEGNADTSKYSYNFVGSNYSGLSTKDTAKEIRSHLKKQFPEVKFSVTSDRNSIDITIKSSPYCNEKLEYSYELSCTDYREYEKEHNKELLSIMDYCNKLLNSYNFDDSDTMSDYFHTHFYSHTTIDYDYTQTEQTESVKNDIVDFRNKLIEDAKAEEERKEKEYQEMEIKRAEQQKQYEIRMEQEKKDIEVINNNIDVVELEEDKQYFVIGSEFAKLNKNDTLDRYKEEVKKGEYYLENVKITKEVHFKNAESLEYFSNLLLNDFDFLQGTGGSFTDDNRINSMTDYYNMDEEERNTVQWNLKGVAVYLNNELQFIVDAQGYSYARYVGLVNNVTIQKDYNTKQILTPEEMGTLQTKSDTLTDISTNTIIDNNLVNSWDKDNWTEYKELLKAELKNNNIRLSKSIIQQLPEEMEELKVAMYKLLIEVDGIQEQFKDADLQQGDKITMYYIGGMGGMIKNQVTFDSVQNTEYAQYKDAIKLTFTPRNKRTQYYNYFYSTMLVYKGWLDLPETVLNDVTKDSNGFICKKSKYTSCDRKQYDEIMQYFEQQGLKPIINTYKPMF